MSTVRADNFGNRAGTSSIPADTLLQGTAKAWLVLNGTGTIAVGDSFNFSGVTDNGAGDYSPNFSSVRPSVTYTSKGTANASNSNGGRNTVLSVYGKTTGTFRIDTTTGTTASNVDASVLDVEVIGDPA